MSFLRQLRYFLKVTEGSAIKIRASGGGIWGYGLERAGSG